jgi:hypothetical protein
MQSYLKRVIETEAYLSRPLSLLGSGAARRREDLSDARYHGPAPRPRALPQEQVDQRNIHCVEHHRVGETRCVYCETPICPDCEYLLVNGRAWCTKCGKRHRSSLITDIGSALFNVFKASMLLAVVIGIVHQAPLELDVRIFTATCVGLLGAWFMFVTEEAELEVRVVKPRGQRKQLRQVVRYPHRARGVSRA